MSRIARGGRGPFRQRAHRPERCARWSGGVLSGSRSAAVPLLAGGGLQAVDGFHLVGDEQIDGGGAGGNLPQAAAVQGDQGGVGQVHALDAGHQVAVLGVTLQVAAQRVGEVLADAVMVAQAQGGGAAVDGGALLG
jgi:hypothetical protein